MKPQQQEDEMERQRTELVVRRKELEDEAVRERRRIEEEERTRRVALSVQVTHPINISYQQTLSMYTLETYQCIPL